ncbi:hypothetical protein KJ762_02885 [bacterium]|nr:hypothetical protein [bacterium]MBU1064502.1 hypothetical protein [bacterium]MBU1633437.1 hypothetical protein [bacterium]MBU1873465.1 hypothetical protein [bacterium]
MLKFNSLFILAFSIVILIVIHSCQWMSTTPHNNNEEPPKISSLESTSDSVKLGEKVTIQCTVYDSDVDLLNYSWSVVPDSFNQFDYFDTLDVDIGNIINKGHEAIWNAPFNEGLFLISCKITNSVGACDSSSIQIKVISDGCLVAKTDKILYFHGDSLELKIINKTDSTAYFFYCSGRIFPCIGIDVKKNNDWKLCALTICDGLYSQYYEGLFSSGVLVDTIKANLPSGMYRFNIAFKWNNDDQATDSLLSNTFYVQ